MDRTASHAHAGHDELLIARLFGGDVTDVERAHALEVMADCPECESLFGELGAMAKATKALPVPLRPRDFTLTGADAARLSRRPRRRWVMSGLGLRRSLGGSLAALGIVGVVLAGTTTVLGGSVSTTNSSYALSPERAAAPSDQGGVAVASASGKSQSGFLAGSEGPAGAPTAMPAGTASAAASGTESPANVFPATSAAATTAGGSAVALNSASPAPDSHDVAAVPPGTAASPETGPVAGGIPSADQGTSSAASSGIDARSVWLAGFGVLLVAGLAMAILPVRRRRRDRDSR